MPRLLSVASMGLALGLAAGGQALPVFSSHPRHLRSLSLVRDPLRFSTGVARSIWDDFDREFEQMERWFADVFDRDLFVPASSVYFNTPQWRTGDIRCEPLRKASASQTSKPAAVEGAQQAAKDAHQLQKADSRTHSATAPDKYLITADVPGFDLSDLTVTINGRVVRIDGQTKCERDAANNNRLLDPLCIERQAHKIAQLPGGLIVDQANARASLDKGVLYVTVPVQPKDPAPEQHRVAIGEGRPDLSVYQRLMQHENADSGAAVNAEREESASSEADSSDGVTVESVPEPTVAH